MFKILFLAFCSLFCRADGVIVRSARKTRS